MLENTWYSVISPESCSSILWRSWDYKETAAEVLKLTAKDMKKNGLIDGIIKEPLGGAHSNPDAMFEIVKREIVKHTKALEKLSTEDLIATRMENSLQWASTKSNLEGWQNNEQINPIPDAAPEPSST